MKNILILLAFFTCIGLNAQDFKVTLNSRAWAGGVCCRMGVNYTLTITGKTNDLQKLVVEAICIDGRYLTVEHSSPLATGSKKKSTRTFTFSYSSDTNPNTGLNGITSPPGCKESGKVYTSDGKSLTIESHKRLDPVSYP